MTNIRKQFNRGEKAFSVMVLNQLDIISKKRNFALNIIYYIKVSSKWIIDLNASVKLKDLISKAEFIKRKFDKLDFMKT